MPERHYNKWTPEMLARCRHLYETGASNQAIAAAFGIKPATVAVMAWQRDWKRVAVVSREKESAQPASSPEAAAPSQQEMDNPSVPAGLEEQAFTSRIVHMIQSYWASQGRPIRLEIETLGCGIQCVRSQSINGIPVMVRR